jgi:hypothetical protein
MKQLREIEIKGGDFELIRLAEDHFCMYMEDNLSVFYKKKELEKLSYARQLIDEWEKISDSDMNRIKNFLSYCGFEFEINELAK